MKSKPKPRQTSDLVASAAARMLAAFRKHGLGRNATLLDGCNVMGVSLRELQAMAASLVAQDQTKGPRRKVRK